MNTQQPKVLRLAHALSGGKLIDDSTEWADTLHAAAAELRRQHARIAELEAQLSAIGAGGVEPLRKQAAPQEVHPESIREGAPYDNPEFEQLARDMGVWGTAQSAVCAQFWLAATQPAAQGMDAYKDRDTIFFLAGWNGCNEGLDAHEQFKKATIAAQAKQGERP